ncbi:Non-canonical purine NTP phosphatase [Diplonema papillatum]|nr:Non-canonical purine NTP phosphatase [Diplonema papillatum]|eukprot:gene12061-18636_t
MPSKKDVLVVAVASLSPTKLEGVRDACSSVIGEGTFVVKGWPCESKVNDQPVGHEETLEGARNRMHALRQVSKDSAPHYLVAIENGIVMLANVWYDIAWVLIERGARIALEDGTNAFSVPTTGVPIPTKLVQFAERSGFDRATVGQSLRSQGIIVDASDPHFSMTKGCVSRRQILAQATSVALGLVGASE